MDSNDEYVDFPELLDRLGHDPLAVLRVGNIRQDREHLLGPGLLDQTLDLGLLPGCSDHHSCALLQVSLRNSPAVTHATAGNYADLASELTQPSLSCLPGDDANVGASRRPPRQSEP